MIPTRDARGIAWVLVLCTPVVYVAWLGEASTPAEAIVPLVALPFGWSLAASFVIPPRWPGPDRVRVWTTLGWRSNRILPGSDIRLTSLRVLRFDGGVTTVTVVSLLGRPRTRRLRCTMSSIPQEATCARLDVEFDRGRA